MSMVKRRSDDDTETVASTQASKSRRRDPVSCLFCRQKKLRCDRKYPCWNCTSRKVDCTWDSEPPQPKKDPHPANGSAQFQNADESLIDRLAALEEVVANQERRIHALEGWDTDLPARTDQGERQVGTSTSEAIDPGWQRTEQATATRVQRLEGLHLAQFGPVEQDGNDEHISIFLKDLPPVEKSRQLVDYYFEKIHYLYSVLDVPTVRSHVEQVYKDAVSLHRVQISHLAIFYTLISVSAYFWPDESDQDLFDSHDDAVKFYQHLVSEVESLLRKGPMNLELLQAECILLHSIPDIRTLAPSTSLGSVIHHAKSLYLHRLDSKINIGERKTEGENSIEVEVKRRLWWHIVTADWFLSLMGGPQHLTYLIQPQHMEVHEPTVVSDEQMALGRLDTKTTNPSGTSYFHERIRLARISREIVDYINQNEGQRVDRRFGTSANPIDSLRLYPSRLASLFPQTTHTGVFEQDRLVWQGLLLRGACHNRICHALKQDMLRDLSRGEDTPTVHSCLASVLETINITHQMQDAQFQPRMYVFRALVHHVFVAVLILLMVNTCPQPLVLNPGAISHTARATALSNGCRFLEKAAQSSQTAHKAVTELMSIFAAAWPRLNELPALAAVPDNDYYLSRPEASQPWIEGLPGSWDLEDIFREFSRAQAGWDEGAWEGLFGALGD